MPQVVHTAVVVANITRVARVVEIRAFVDDEALAHRLLKRVPVGGRNEPLDTDGPRGEGQPTPQARKLERDGPLGREATARGLIDTLGTSDAGDTQPRIVKVVSGGRTTVRTRSTGPNPQELKRRRGHE